MRSTRHDAFAILIPGFSESELGTGNDIPGISRDILGISDRNQYTRYIKNMSQPASIYLTFREGKTQ